MSTSKMSKKNLECRLGQGALISDGDILMLTIG
jgi:hypothetical protein